MAMHKQITIGYTVARLRQAMKINALSAHASPQR
jgi:hypothetical protein